MRCSEALEAAWPYLCLSGSTLGRYIQTEQQKASQICLYLSQFTKQTETYGLMKDLNVRALPFPEPTSRELARCGTTEGGLNLYLRDVGLFV